MNSLRGLYAITPDRLCRDRERLLRDVGAALDGGAAMVQYRDKQNPQPTRLDNASRLAALCSSKNAPLIINDDANLAAACGAAGVHLGRSDGTVDEARHLLGDNAIIGVTCGNDLKRALEAQAAGASYVSFGRFFESKTKPEAPPADPLMLPAAREALSLPICVIGGLTPSNAGPLLACGADLVAAAGGIFDADDVEARTREYAALFTTIPG